MNTYPVAVLSILLLLLSFSPETAGIKTLFVVLDGFRYDYVKIFKTPNLERIVGQSNTFFHPGLTPAFPSTTLPNLASMISGNFSDTHGITGGKSPSTSSRDFWSRLRGMGTIWDAYISSSSSESKRVPGLIDWPSSSELTSQKKGFYIRNLQKPVDFPRRTAQIKSLFLNESLDFVSIYVDEPGLYAIPYGPESKQVNESIMHLDNWIGDLMKEFQEDTNILIASTPGYLNASLSNVIYLNKILKNKTYSLAGSSPFLSVIPKEGEEIDIFLLLERQEHFKTYSKSKIPPHWHYTLEPQVKMVLLASEGTVFEDFFLKVKRFQSQHNIKEPLDRIYGLNGYAEHMEKSRSILLGVGPAFRRDEVDSSSSTPRTEGQIVDIYPLLCHVLGIKTPSDRRGSLEPFLGDLSEPPAETMEKIKAVLKRISNLPAIGTIGVASLILLLTFLCIIFLMIYRRKSKKLDHSYSYTQIRENRRGDTESQEEEFEKVEFLGMEDEFHEAEEEDLLSEDRVGPFEASRNPSVVNSC